MLVKERLVACVNIVPKIKSIYRWKRKTCYEFESLILGKTSARNVRKVIKKVKEIHSYKIPCIVVLDIAAGDKEYLNWIGRQIQ